ncbi:CHAD domain-containing protein [Aestuariivirga sp.]|uniref:CYTH and CHAD domain-containing protein n=1 Tax=Aestuariivirga sp. TaxID=2650926 RepID=UPI0039E2BA97
MAAPGGVETEVKFRASAQSLRDLLALPLFAGLAAGPSALLKTTYYDTADGDLIARKIVLRVRREGRGRPVLCVKLPPKDNPFKRGEIEVPSPKGLADILLFDDEVSQKLADILNGKPLVSQFDTVVRRQLLHAGTDAAAIEMALDEGEVVAGRKRQPLAEVELELKSGEEASLYALAIQLAREAPLRLEFLSKSQRGFLLAQGKVPSPVKASPLRLEAGAVDDGIAAILGNGLAHFTANWAALRAGEDVESVHQLRVALRRTRSALGVFSKFIPCAEFLSFRERAGGIAAQFGPARDCDVFEERLRAGPLSSGDRPSSADAVMARLKLAREKAYADARAVIEGEEATCFVLDIQAFLARRGWASAREESLGGITAEGFAASALEKLHKRVRKRGKGFAQLDDHARHRLRIALKNLRYGIEFFGGLFGHAKRQQSWLAVISDLQDRLGAHNDVVTARRLLGELTAGGGAEMSEAAGFILGWEAREAILAEKELGEAWDTLKAQEPFWTKPKD